MLCIGYPNLLTPAITVWGGDWGAANPITNARTADLSSVARSTDATTDSTKFYVDWGTAIEATALVIVAHNLSSAGTLRRLRGSTSGGSEVSDTGDMAAWAFSPDAYDGRAHNVIVLSALGSARYDTVQITDTANAAGYVEIGMAYFSPLWRPTYDASVGLVDTLLPMGAVQRSQAGALWRNAGRTLRQATFVLDALEADTFAGLHEIQRIASLTEPVLYLRDDTNRADSQRFGFVGTFEELSQVEYPHFRRRRVPLRVTEFA